MEKSTALLKSMIGKQVLYHQRHAVVIDVIEHPPELVLLVSDKADIQEDTYGSAYRETPRTITLPIVCKDTQDIQGCLQELLGPNSLERLKKTFLKAEPEPPTTH